MDDDTYDDNIKYMLRISIDGDPNVGKTSVLKRFMLDHTNFHTTSAIAVRDVKVNSKYHLNIKPKSKSKLKSKSKSKSNYIRVQLLDSNPYSLYRDVHAVIIVVDPWNIDSFSNLKQRVNRILWLSDNKNLQIFIVSNKCDLDEQNRLVSYNEAVNYINKNKIYAYYYEVSAKTGFNFNDMIITIIERTLNNIYNVNSSSLPARSSVRTSPSVVLSVNNEVLTH